MSREQMDRWLKVRKEFKPSLESLSYNQLEELKDVIDCEMAQRYLETISDEFEEACKQIGKEMEACSQRMFHKKEK
jgi:Mg2+ and Co2+ transporter CorA